MVYRAIEWAYGSFTDGRSESRDGSTAQRRACGVENSEDSAFDPPDVSGDFGMNADIPLPFQSRLTRLAQKPSLESPVSLRGESCQKSIRDGLYECAVHVLKDKHHLPLWMHRERYGGPIGLC